jgi:trimethylamine--corrinoid protein Co-methyltransferase
MYDRMQTFTMEELTKIHDASLHVLKNVGVMFDDDEAIDIFKDAGHKVNGKIVYFSEKQISRALDSVPEQFVLSARNAENSVPIGGDNFGLAPGYGAPFIITPQGEQRRATMSDYDDFCKLVQTSKWLNVNGFLMVMPSDVPSETAYLDLLYSNMVYCDKPFMGSPLSRMAARDCVNWTGTLWGGKENLPDTPVTASLITPLSPLQYTSGMAGSVIEFARYNQACVFGVLLMAGSSATTSLAGVIVQQTAEILAGVTLTQLVHPGAPVIAGGTGAILDMRTGCLSMGAPEVAKIAAATMQMAKFYNMPARSGCAVTDAHLPDAQAGFESALNLIIAFRNGSNFILHAAGILGSYNAMSFEKFIIDEEICGFAHEYLKPVVVTDETIGLDIIEEVGIGGDHLSHRRTLEQCRTAFYLPDLVNRNGYAGWQENGNQRIDEKATHVLNDRLSSYVKPDIDAQIEKDLQAYIQKRKREF